MSCASRLGGRRRFAEASELAVSSGTTSILPLSEIARLAHDQRVTASRILQTIASGPTSHVPPVERRRRRAAVRSLRMQPNASATRATVLLVYERAAPHRLAARSNSRWSRVLSQLLAPSLDRKLAEGRPPETHLLLAARAHVLVSPVKRQALAHTWADLLELTRRPPRPRDLRTPINRDCLLSHQPEIRALLDVLVAPTPGHVRGIALLSWLLSDGAGPLYNWRRSDELRGVLLDATALLDSPAM